MIDLSEAPRDVQKAASTVAAHAALGMKPPKDLMEYVSKWVRKQQEQDRYGK